MYFLFLLINCFCVAGSHLSKLPYFGPIAAEELPAAYAEKHLDTDLLFRSEFEASGQNPLLETTF